MKTKTIAGLCVLFVLFGTVSCGKKSQSENTSTKPAEQQIQQPQPPVSEAQKNLLKQVLDTNTTRLPDNFTDAWDKNLDFEKIFDFAEQVKGNQELVQFVTNIDLCVIEDVRDSYEGGSAGIMLFDISQTKNLFRLSVGANVVANLDTPFVTHTFSDEEHKVGNAEYQNAFGAKVAVTETKNFFKYAGLYFPAIKATNTDTGLSLFCDLTREYYENEDNMALTLATIFRTGVSNYALTNLKETQVDGFNASFYSDSITKLIDRSQDYGASAPLKVKAKAIIVYRLTSPFTSGLSQTKQGETTFSERQANVGSVSAFLKGNVMQVAIFDSETGQIVARINVNTAACENITREDCVADQLTRIEKLYPAIISQLLKRQKEAMSNARNTYDSTIDYEKISPANCYMLGVLTCNGAGTPQDIRKGIAFMQLALQCITAKYNSSFDDSKKSALQNMAITINADIAYWNSQLKKQSVKK